MRFLKKGQNSRILPSILFEKEVQSLKALYKSFRLFKPIKKDFNFKKLLNGRRHIIFPIILTKHGSFFYRLKVVCIYSGCFYQYYCVSYIKNKINRLGRFKFGYHHETECLFLIWRQEKVRKKSRFRAKAHEKYSRKAPCFCKSSQLPCRCKFVETCTPGAPVI